MYKGGEDLFTEFDYWKKSLHQLGNLSICLGGRLFGGFQFEEKQTRRNTKYVFQIKK